MTPLHCCLPSKMKQTRVLCKKVYRLRIGRGLLSLANFCRQETTYAKQTRVKWSTRNGREFNTARVRSILKAIGSVERKGSVTFNLDPPKIGSPPERVFLKYLDPP